MFVDIDATAEGYEPRMRCCANPGRSRACRFATAAASPAAQASRIVATGFEKVSVERGGAARRRTDREMSEAIGAQRAWS